MDNSIEAINNDGKLVTWGVLIVLNFNDLLIYCIIDWKSTPLNIFVTILFSLIVLVILVRPLLLS